MSDDARLSLSVEHADGSLTRWGPDEVDSGRIPSDLSFTNSTPGGFGSLTCSLLRDLTPQADENLFDTVRAYGPGGQVAWEGRMSALPRGDHALNPTAAGWSAHLEDDQSFREIFVDRDPSSWGEPPLTRRIQHATGGLPQGGVPVQVDGSGIVWTPTAGQALLNGDATEVMYQAPAGLQAAIIQYRGQRQGTWTGFDPPTVYTSGTRAMSSVASAALTLDDTLRAQAVTPGRYVMLRTIAAGAVTPGTGMAQSYSRLAVYGGHGMPLHSTGAGEPDGVYASDVVTHVIDLAAPLLSYTTGATGTVQSTTFAIPQLAFKEPTTAAEVIGRANAYHGWDWMVWEGRTFYFVPAASGVQWQARQSDGASLQLEGDAADQIINGVVVAYTDDGTQKYAGPVGSGGDVESSALQDTSSDNPFNAHFPTARRWPVLQMSVPTTDAGAVEVGALYLQERNIAARRGSISVTGSIRHPTEGLVPVWRIRAGDTITVSDVPGGVVRRIISVSYQHSTRTAQLELDNTAHHLDSILSRLATLAGGLS
jgi:hypothetical protein